MGKVYIIGTGPGSRDFFLPLAERLINDADMVIASPRLRVFVPKGRKFMAIDGNYPRAMEYIKKHVEDKKIAVLVSGDPGVFSFSKKITGALDESQYEVVPGISSLQLACARVGQSWDGLCLVSVHGRSLRGLNKKVSDKKNVMLFCDNRNTPSHVAKYLSKKVMGKIQVTAFGNLSLSDEEIIKTNIESLSKLKRKWGGLWLLLIRNK